MNVCSVLIILMQIGSYTPLHFFESYQLLQMALLSIAFTYKKYYNNYDLLSYQKDEIPHDVEFANLDEVVIE